MAGLPRWPCGKESTCQCGRHVFDPWVEKNPWRRKQQSTLVSLLGKSHGQRKLAEYKLWDPQRIRYNLETKKQQQPWWLTILNIFHVLISHFYIFFGDESASTFWKFWERGMYMNRAFFLFIFMHICVCVCLCVCVCTYMCFPGGSVQFSHSVVSDSLQPHGLQHARLPCPLPTPGVYSNSYPSHRGCHPTISSSFIPFSSHLQSFQHQGLFQWVSSLHQVAPFL